MQSLNVTFVVELFVIVDKSYDLSSSCVGFAQDAQNASTDCDAPAANPRVTPSTVTFQILSTAGPFLFIWLAKIGLPFERRVPFFIIMLAGAVLLF